MKKASLSKHIAIALSATVLLTACGGGGSDGDSSSKTTDTTPTTPTIPPVVTPPVVTPPDLDTNDTSSETSIASIGNKNHQIAALGVANFISMERQACGLGGLEYDPKLAAMSVKHANYIQYVLSNTKIGNLNPHEENGFVGFEDYTGTGNPYFSGVTFNDRLIAAQPATPTYFASENIVQRILSSSDGVVDSPEDSAISMARGLMSAPYHLRMLINPDRAKSGTSVITFTPKDRAADTNIGYVLVDTAASASNAAPVVPEGIVTYPCSATKGTVTALYNESPDPTKGTGRNLRTDPIGQPIHILVPSADDIKVSNIKVTDVARKLNVPVQTVDYDNDPYKGTNYQLPNNEAFIMPITDSLKSCEAGKTYNRTNCGLHGNSKYQVSFDVLVDNEEMLSKSFIFETGDVNY